LIQSTNDETKAYLSSNYLPNATNDEVDKLLTVYPADVSAGSPFDTGANNTLTPEFKRLAAFTGDLVFTGPRRFFLKYRAEKQPAWSFCVYLYFTIQLITNATAIQYLRD
jgi:acetylcholinesterase